MDEITKDEPDIDELSLFGDDTPVFLFNASFEDDVEATYYEEF